MTLVFASALAIQLIFWLLLGIGYRRVQSSQPESASFEANELPVSVIVAARNEEANLPTLLDALAHQSYSSFEVIVADDASVDSTPDILEERKANWPSQKLTSIRIQDGGAESSGLPRKKYALTRAINAATYDRLLFTDADCVPGRDWVGTVIAHLQRDSGHSKDILVGYGPYLRERNALNAFVRYETLLTAVQTIAAIAWKKPFMAVGRNLSYTKDLFEKIGGFAHSASSLSGDDDLFIQEAS
ncbi:MAG: glycosyltransferase, partial [Rubricoccaceae bacterium]|nr:glycosyltransferase [Rubricoccaceae bacterium]